MPGPKSGSAMERFLRYVRIDDAGCWLWVGGKTRGGYGVFRMNQPRRNARAPRAAFELFIAPPGDLLVCHRCDVPACVNPDHLFLGTHKDNMADAVRKGRVRNVPMPGEAHPRARLTEADVRTIRERVAAGEKRVDIARDYGVVYQQVSNIAARRSWAHVN